jgi:hypothetical protein
MVKEPCVGHGCWNWWRAWLGLVAARPLALRSGRTGSFERRAEPRC